MKKLFFILFVSGCLGLVSCDPAKQYSTEISKIDSCLTVINDINEKYNGIEFDSLALMVDHVLRNEDTLKKYYNPDTLSMDIGVRMNDCKGIRKTLKGVRTKETDFKIEIDELTAQFENLKKDISEGVLTKEQVNDYLARELFDLNILDVSFSDFYENQLIQKKYYYESVPYIDDLIVEIKNEIPEE